LEIVENHRGYLNDFIRLNEEWISTYFEIEEIDRTLASNPGRVIDNGGYVFSIIVDNEVVGVCALFNDGNGIYELARMAVTPKHQGKGYGELLIKACLSKLRDIKANKVYLISNSKLKAAISLYKKHGFKTISTEQHPVYSRANLSMEYYVS